MIAAAALALALAAGTDPLASARAALAAGDLATAERLALEAAAPPHEAEALYVAGLARFRAGRAAEALEAIDRAGPGADAPGPYHYNRGACLLDLGRLEEAERAFELAAEDPALAVAALVNAGYAALDAGALERAGGHAARARAAAGGAGGDLVDDLERALAAAAGDRAAAAYAEALAAFDAGRFEAARASFVAAAEAVPADGKSRLMAGAASLRLGRREEGVADVQRALALGLGAEDARVARAYLAAAGEPRTGGDVRLELGWDTNALQAGAGAGDERPGAYSPETESAVAIAGLDLSWAGRSGGLRLEGAYALEQLAYAADAARDFSVQQHALVVALEGAPRRGLHLGAAAEGLLAFTGLEDFRGLQAAAGLRGWATLALGEAAWTRLDLAVAPRRGLAEFDYLGGTRLESALSLGWTSDWLALGLGWRWLRDDLGVARAEVTPPPSPLCELGCTAERVAPSGYDGNLVWASARIGGAGALALDLAAGAEWRRYHADDRLTVTPTGGTPAEVAAARREDLRTFAGAAFWWRLSERVSLLARCELVVNDSSLADEGSVTGGHHMMEGQASPLGDPSYRKTVLTAGATFAW